LFSTVPDKVSPELILSPEQVHAAQLQAVRNAFPQFYDYEKDSVDDSVTISQLEDNYISWSESATIRVSAEVLLKSPADFPSVIGLHFISHSPEWIFLDDHDFTIRYDNQKLTPDGTYYGNKVLDDATVTETIWPDFTLQQFHDIAWAQAVNVKIGGRNYEIPYEARQKWKLLWKYFDLQKSDRDAALKKAIGEKP
jgi:hypothetical protein